MTRRLTTLFFSILAFIVGIGFATACGPVSDITPVDSPNLTVTAIEEEPTQTVFSTETLLPFEEARLRLVETGIIAYGIEDPTVIEAMSRTPRHLFVPEQYLQSAYANHPLPIGYGQTISQPFIVALMSQELGVTAGDRVLEIGTGSGYQAAVLAEMGTQVFSIEIIGALAEEATERLAQLGYDQVQVKHADGYFGWEEEGPFDGIIVTAAPDHVPQPLLSQLKIGASLVIPVGPVGGYQELWRITRIDAVNFRSQSLGGVSFVPFTREKREQ
jgi:protein-L-isoaspartate(D-aspartate) O-methyltransferase